MDGHQCSINNYPSRCLSEHLRSVEEILDEISGLDQQLKELEDSLSL